MGPRGKPGCFIACVLLTTHILLVHGYRETFVIKSECEINADNTDWVETPCIYCYQDGGSMVPCVWTQDGDEWRISSLLNPTIDFYPVGAEGTNSPVFPSGIYEVVTRRVAYTTSIEIQRWSWSTQLDVSWIELPYKIKCYIQNCHLTSAGMDWKKRLNALKPGDTLTVCSTPQWWESDYGEVCTPCYGEGEQWDAVLRSCTCTSEFQLWDPITQSCRCRGGYT
jgi:hypothetical protein